MYFSKYFDQTTWDSLSGYFAHIEHTETNDNQILIILANLTFKFFHHIFLFNLPACDSNWVAPICKASKIRKKKKRNKIKRGKLFIIKRIKINFKQVSSKIKI